MQTAPNDNARHLPQDQAAKQAQGQLTAAPSSPGEKAQASVWKPVVARVVLGGFALLGLAAVGALSMFAGLDGARASSPRVVSRAADSALLRAAPLPAPSASASAANELPAAAPSAGPALTTACNAGRTADGKVVLNLATLDDLRTLPGIGQKRAQAILALRDKLKKFRKIQELRRVRGIGAKTLNKLAPKLLVDPPPGAGCSST